MRLVMFYTAGDGCSYSCEQSIPINYESAEAALIDFETACMSAGNSRNVPFFDFAGRQFCTREFFDSEAKMYVPDFLTVDEWFEREAKE